MFQRRFISLHKPSYKFGAQFNQIRGKLFNLNKMRFSTGVSVERSYGGLKDQDRIFTNVYRDGDPFIEGAMKRVS